jgi:hypothetical protein
MIAPRVIRIGRILGIGIYLLGLLLILRSAGADTAIAATVIIIAGAALAAAGIIEARAP